MREGCAVEIEAQRVRWAVGRRVQPQKACARVDKALDQPGACHTIHPQVAARGPEPPLVLHAVAPGNAADRRLRLARRLHGFDGVGKVPPLGFGADRGFTGEEVDLADGLVGPRELALQALKFSCAQAGECLARLRQCLQPGCVVGCPVEQRLEGGLLGHVPGLHLQQPGLATFLQSLVGQCL